MKYVYYCRWYGTEVQALVSPIKYKFHGTGMYQGKTIYAFTLPDGFDHSAGGEEVVVSTNTDDDAARRKVVKKFLAMQESKVEAARLGLEREVAKRDTIMASMDTTFFVVG